MSGNSRKISDIVDIPNAQKQVNELLTMLSKVKNTINEMPQIYGKAKNSDSAYSTMIKEMEALKSKQNEMVTAAEELNNANQKRIKTEHDLALEQAKAKIQAEQKRKDIKDEAREALGLNDAYRKLEDQYKKSAREAKNLAAQYGVGSKEAKAAATSALDLANKLKKIDETVGQSHRNVGNYKVAVREALEESGLLGTVGGQKIMMLEGAFNAVKKGVGAVGQAFGSLKGALLASGIGALIIGLGMLFSWLEKTKEGSRVLGETMGGLKGVWEGITGSFANFLSGTGSSITQLTTQMAMWWGMGKTIAQQTRQIAIDERIETVKNSELHKEIVQLKEKSMNYTLNLEQKSELLNKAMEKSLEMEDLKEEHAKEELKHIQTQIALKTMAGIYDKELLNKEAEAKAHVNEVEAEAIQGRRRIQKELQTELKALRQEERDYEIAMLNQEQSEKIDNNQKILANEHSTLKQKIAAERSSLDETLKLMDAEREAKLDDPSLTPKKRMTIIQETNTAEQKAIRDSNESQRKLREEYMNRDIVASTAIEKTKLEMKREAINNELKEDQQLYESQLNFKTRAGLLQKAADIDIQAENNSYQRDTKILVGKTQLEIEAMAEEHNRKLALITTKGELDLMALRKEFYKKNISDQQKDQFNAESGQLDEYNGKLKALYNNLKEGKMSFSAFTDAKTNLDDTSSIDSINSQIVAMRQLKETAIKESDFDSADKYERHILELTKNRTEKQIYLEAKAADKKKQLREKEIELAQKTGEFIHKQLNNQIEVEKNANSKKLELIESQKAADLERVNSSTLSEQQKAVEIDRINQNAIKQKEAIDKRQRELDQKKAQNDKKMAIFNIILETAVGVMKASPTVALMAIIGAIGAISLATAIATPIPKYAVGTESSKEGFALTDEKGAEGYLTRSGKFSIGSSKGANIKYLEAGTKVIPTDELNKFLFKSMLKNYSLDFQEPGQKNNELNQLSNTIMWQTGQIKDALKKNRARVTVNVNGISDHIKQQIYR
jgi:hypothetical protein